MLIAEDLLLLLYDDESGRARFDGNQISHALAGAILVELSMDGKIGVAEPGENVKKGRLVIRDDEPTGDEVLDAAMSRLARDREKKPKDVLGALRKGKREILLERLADNRTLRRDDRKVLGIFSVTRWPLADVTHKTQVRERIRTVLAEGGLEPDERTAALVSLLHAVDGITKVIPCDDKRAAKRRAKEISESAWAGEAVRQAVQEVNTVVTAVVAGAVVSGAAGGS